jgi:hypothetical protein
MYEIQAMLFEVQVEGSSGADLQQLAAEAVAVLLQSADVAGGGSGDVQFALQVGDADGRHPDLILAVPVLRFPAAERRLLQPHLRRAGTSL